MKLGPCYKPLTSDLPLVVDIHDCDLHFEDIFPKIDMIFQQKMCYSHHLNLLGSARFRTVAIYGGYTFSPPSTSPQNLIWPDSFSCQVAMVT